MAIKKIEKPKPIAIPCKILSEEFTNELFSTLIKILDHPQKQVNKHWVIIQILNTLSGDEYATPIELIETLEKDGTKDKEAKEIMDKLADRNYTVPLERLKPWNPFKNIIWTGLKKPITKEEIRRTIECSNRKPSIRSWHIEKIAELVKNNAETTIDIEFKIQNQNNQNPWPITDGNHRLAAAFYRKDRKITIKINGNIKLSKQKLGINEDWKKI